MDEPYGILGYVNRKFREYRKSALKRSITFKLTKAQFKSFIYKNCYYCGAIPAMRTKGRIPINGIDRIDSSLGYTMANCVTACSTCNRMKSIFSKEEFLNAVRKIYSKTFGPEEGSS